MSGWIALVPAPAYAFDGTALASGGGAGLIVAGIGLALLYRQRRRLAVLEGECARLRGALERADGRLQAAPAALYAWHRGVERRVGGNLASLSPLPPRFADLLSRLGAEERAALIAAVDALRRGGTAFALSLRLAGDGAVLDAQGRRQGEQDLVWLLDTGARRRLEAERDGLRRWLDALPWPVWRRGGDLALIDCNRAYAVALDTAPSQAVAEGIELARGILDEGGRGLAARAKAAGAPQVERRHIVIAGSRRFLEIAETPLAGGGDLAGFARDLTDLETAQAELARHIAAHDEVMERIGVAIAIYGPDRHLIFANTAFAQLWRLEEDFLGTQPLLEEVLERLRERRRLPEYADFRAFRRQQQAMFTSLLTAQEELLHLPDERTLRLVISPHPFGGLIFAYEDVTDRLALERSYNTLIEVQRETLDNLYEGIAVFGSDGRLKLFNPAYGQIWHLPPEALTGEPHVSEITERIRGFFAAGSAEWPGRKDRIIARLTAQTPTNTRLHRADGSILQAVTVPLPDGNTLLSYLDVTDSLRVENALRERNEALETTDRLKSEFIANVSYELRTPLNAITGFAEMLANQYFGELNPRQLGYSQNILDSANQLAALINDILDLATIEAGYMELTTQPVELHALLSSVVTLTRERARVQDLRLDLDCPADIGAIQADERRLKQALFNLISNALKFTPAGGTVTLRARREGKLMALSVSDTGIGVPEEDQARIFGKFERGSPHAGQGGAGLGLSLVKSFIELHGGRVEIESSPGRGTTITCYLAAA